MGNEELSLLAQKLKSVEPIISNASVDRRAANLSSGSPDQAKYIVKGLIPNVIGTFEEYERKLRVETNSFERMILKEQRFVEILKLFAHPDIVRRLQLILQEINNTPSKPIDVGLVLIGSAALGGLLVREAVGTNNDAWVDIDLVGSYYKTEDWKEGTSVREYMVEVVLKKLKSMINHPQIKTLGSNDYEICDAFSPDKFNFPVLATKEDAEDLLEKGRANSFDYDLFYFFPSYPHHMNDLSRYNILLALKDLCLRDQAKWEEITSKLLASFETQIHPLRSKHFGKDEKDLTGTDLNSIKRFISALFSDLLADTGKTEG